MKVSVVIPVYNEQENIPILYRQLKASLASIVGASEIIIVDDGSTDRTFKVLCQLHKQDPSLLVIRFSRNFGQTAALAAGIKQAQGEIIVTLDGDLQNDPDDIPRMVAKLEEGYDLVNGWRCDRQDPFFSRQLPSRLANSLISCITKVKLHDYGCTLKAFRSDVAKSIHLYGELHRFIPALVGNLGTAIAEVTVNHRPRSYGKSHYGLGRTVRVMLDLVTIKFFSRYATRPLHMFGFLGLLCTISGAAITTYLGLNRIVFGESLTNRPMLLLGILLVVVGVQFVTMGLLGEMMVRIYHETQQKPIYWVREILATSASGNGRVQGTYVEAMPVAETPPLALQKIEA
ncbi:MAG: glycosyltransferase family 2 protein [Candidatus Binatia bacterium]